VVKYLKDINFWPFLGSPEAKGQASKLASFFKVNERTFRNWMERLRKDPNWEGPLRKTDRDHTKV